MTHGICILGATGSIGQSTLDVVERHPGRFRVVAVSANTEVEKLARSCAQHEASYAVIADANLVGALQTRLGELGCAAKVLGGPSGLVEIATLEEVRIVMAAIVGAAGLAPTLAAARAGKRLLLANKEALVMAGPVFMNIVASHGAELLPIDSEHNAIFQCMPPNRHGASRESLGIRRIYLTGSGGPFRNRNQDQLENVTPEEACAHPTWEMGKKISVDSATMMNKALEVIEAHFLFGVPADAIQVVIHPQSVVHSMVEYVDGSVIAQLGNPDMRTPIAQALAYPDRIEAGVVALNLFTMGNLNFDPPDFVRFPALRLAYQALALGGSAPTILNAANEVAVAAFLGREIRFNDVIAVIEETSATISVTPIADLDDVLAADAHARRQARLAVGRRIGRAA
ncbi:MAG: 1-deoxy-D-xylulose-5-phosphate reductoisomerase [Burkholderiales bacterium]